MSAKNAKKAAENLSKRGFKKIQFLIKIGPKSKMVMKRHFPGDKITILRKAFCFEKNERMQKHLNTFKNENRINFKFF